VLAALLPAYVGSESSWWDLGYASYAGGKAINEGRVPEGGRAIVSARREMIDGVASQLI